MYTLQPKDCKMTRSIIKCFKKNRISKRAKHVNYHIFAICCMILELFPEHILCSPTLGEKCFSPKYSHTDIMTYFLPKLCSQES